MIYGFTEKIKNLRLQKGLTQVQIAKRLNITKNAVYSWEMGTSSPSLINLARLAQIFGVSTDYLLGVNERLTIDITEYDDLQKEAIHSLTQIFKKMNDNK
ncbi:MAG: helix-turn-helix domain-containing protein [Oscillospiraceae bacterium]|jgi:transcriptional regulator with XRE-family HTH domain|nr:helix-turn-helix domain-containing protein [Oscillospiraceae bacterium]